MTGSPPEVKWRSLDPAQRRRIGRAVGKGRAVDDPRDAPYAVGYANAMVEWLSWRRRFWPIHLLLVVLLFAELGFTWSWRPAVLLFPLVGFGWLRLRTPRLRRKIEASRGLNAGLAEQLGQQPVRVLLPVDVFRPRSRLRRSSLVVLAVSLVAAIGLAASAAISAHRRAKHWAAAASRICAREQARVDALPSRLGRYERRRRANVAEQDELTALERLTPDEQRTSLQSRFLSWKRYELELDLWYLDGLARGDRPIVAAYPARARAARDETARLARRLGARACA
jgi:hypothetical protein